MALDVSGTLIGRLWAQNADLVEQFLNNEFCKFQAESDESETMASYHYYSVQDYFYLVDYVKYKAIRLARCPLDASANDLSALEQGAKSVLRQVHSAKEFREVVLQGELQLSGGVIDGSARCEEERRYAEWLQDGGEGGWYGMYVKSIPCIYGWYVLASRLSEAESTRKDTVFYKTWVLPNITSDPVIRLLDFLKAYSHLDDPSMEETWSKLFRTGMEMEIGVFNAASGKQIIGSRDKALHDEALHDKALHDEGLHDEGLHDEGSHDECSHDEYLQGVPDLHDVPGTEDVPDLTDDNSSCSTEQDV